MSAPKLSARRILILATDGFEQSELAVPQKELTALGATVHVAAPKTGSIKGWNHTDWGNTVKVDLALSQADAKDYDALVLPGGQMNPDEFRRPSARAEGDRIDQGLCRRRQAYSCRVPRALAAYRRRFG